MLLFNLIMYSKMYILFSYQELLITSHLSFLNQKYIFIDFQLFGLWRETDPISASEMQLCSPKQLIPNNLM